MNQKIVETFYFEFTLVFIKTMNNCGDMLKGGVDGSPEDSIKIPIYLQV